MRAEGVLGRPEHCEVPSGPAVTLEQIRRQVVRSETLHQRLPVVAGRPAVRVHLDGGVEVLGDGLRRHPPNFREGCPPNDCSRPAPEHAVVAVLARQDDFEEHALVVATGLEVLERIMVAKVVRGLDHGHLGVVEVAHRCVQDVRLWDVIGIEDEE